MNQVNLLCFVYDFNLGLCSDRSVGVAGGGVVVGQLSVGRADNLRKQNTSEHTGARAGHVLWRESSSSEATTKSYKSALWTRVSVYCMLESRRPSVWRRPTHLHWSMPIGWRQVAQSIWRLLWNIRPCSTLDSTLASFQQSIQQKRQTKKSENKNKTTQGLRGRQKTKALLYQLLQATGI